MKNILFCLLALSLIGISKPAISQNSRSQLLDSIFSKSGEVYFTFKVADKEDIHTLTRLISIDHVKGKTVHAYANKKEFSDFLRYDAVYTILPHPGTLIPENEVNARQGADRPGNRTSWNFYPTYQQYVDYMVGFAASYPGICKLDTIGTTMQGRLILAVKISKNVNQEEAEPQFLYTSSIHGDETTGYVLMLHLIDYLLTNYGVDPAITTMVNTTEICINPLANPDGTYHGGNNSVYGAVRYNANNVDLNRNFPDPKAGQHPDGNAWQVETEAWMAYAGSNHFSMSANFHGGSEVFNYPWDTWAKLAADDDWWQFVGREWADTVHVNGPAGYFTFLNNGITNGYAWYEITGGRQDYMNYWHNCREVTVEISNTKLLPVSQLLSFWNYNYRSFLNFIEEAHYGFNGIVTDTVNDQPVAAKVFINGHDIDFSEVYSRSTTGFYARPIFEGSYNVTFSAPGYYTKTIRNVSVSKWTTTNLDVQLRPLTYDSQDKSVSSVLVYPNPSDGHFKLILPENPINPSCSIQILNTLGAVIYSAEVTRFSENSTVEIAVPNLANGLYYLKFNSGYRIYLDKLIIKK
ncbi:MAG: M14 family zinc carboxypeptidase [Bacteroidetes bacterium]|nr:M14 family zinc carboxypeptidase [Bacteroidota bacterium]